LQRAKPFGKVEQICDGKKPEGEKHGYHKKALQEEKRSLRLDIFRQSDNHPPGRKQSLLPAVIARIIQKSRPVLFCRVGTAGEVDTAAPYDVGSA
jgi:hypothetical protein